MPSSVTLTVRVPETLMRPLPRQSLPKTIPTPENTPCSHKTFRCYPKNVSLLPKTFSTPKTHEVPKKHPTEPKNVRLQIKKRFPQSSKRFSSSKTFFSVPRYPLPPKTSHHATLKRFSSHKRSTHMPQNVLFITKRFLGLSNPPGESQVPPPGPL